MPARPRSAAIITWPRGNRSTTVPATRPSASTGKISITTAPRTFAPEPVISKHDHDEGDGVEGVAPPAGCVCEEGAAETPGAATPGEGACIGGELGRSSTSCSDSGAPRSARTPGSTAAPQPRGSSATSMRAPSRAPSAHGRATCGPIGCSWSVCWLSASPSSSASVCGWPQ